jgi:hypothetical protein
LTDKEAVKELLAILARAQVVGADAPKVIQLAQWLEAKANEDTDAADNVVGL